MAITKDVIKVMASESLTDFDDGGGMMSGNEIVSGNVNNLFPDISPLDRALGRVSLRKAYAIAMTDDNDTYQGCHIILSDPPDDPRVSVSIFTTNDHFDHREDARDRIESYVVQGVKYSGYLYGNQLEGSRAIQIVQRETVALPRVGDVLFLIQNAGLSNEISQYVRITGVTGEVRTFSVLSGGSYVDIKRRVVTIEIGDALRSTFNGAEPSYADIQGAAVPYNTMVADAAKYYGVKPVVEEIVAGSFTVRAETIFNHLVPSAQAESPVIDITAGGSVSGTKTSGTTVSFSTSLTVTTGTKIYCGTGLVRGTLVITSGSSTWSDDKRGNLTRAGVIEGTVEYGTGIVTFQISGVSGTFSVSYTPAAPTSGINRTHGIYVTLASRAYNYTATLDPIPEPGTLIVDYMAQGNWYRLIENGAGELLPLISGTGSGIFNPETGSCIVTCGALPDVGSVILYSWSASVEYQEAVTTTLTNPFYHEFVLPAPYIEAGSVSFTYDGIAVTDNGSGGLNGVTGSIDYQTGVVKIYPSTLKATAEVDIDLPVSYDAIETGTAKVTGSEAVSAGPTNTLFTLGAITPNTLVIEGLLYTKDGGSFTVTARDYSGTLKSVGNVCVTVATKKICLKEGTTVGTVAPATGEVVIHGALEDSNFSVSEKVVSYGAFTGGLVRAL
ncbi:MAG: hypothetical protein A2Y38_12930 [Spirochaetes bacterium GWB1_59_5]|nr:MAG: hypothetical protein A2Y38_12930 [Spirochaetes bacterium GWB1_59_5]